MRLDWQRTPSPDTEIEHYNALVEDHRSGTGRVTNMIAGVFKTKDGKYSAGIHTLPDGPTEDLGECDSLVDAQKTCESILALDGRLAI